MMDRQGTASHFSGRKRIVYFIFFAVIFALVLGSVRISADEGGASASFDSAGISDSIDGLEEYLADFRKALPQAALEALPDDLTDSDALRELAGVEYLFSYICECLSGGISSFASSILTVIGLTVVSCTVITLTSSDSHGAQISMAVSLACALGFASVTSAMPEMVHGYLSDMSDFTTTLLPIVGSLLLCGGNTAGAASSGAALGCAGVVLEKFCAEAITPVVGVCMAFAIISPLCGARFDVILREVKKVYVFVLLAVSTLITSSLLFQSSLAANADSLAARGVKFAFGNMFPIVGSSLSDSMRSVAAGLSFIRGTVGTASVVVILMITLPPLAYLFVMRFTFVISSALEELLGCQAQKKMTDAFASAYDVAIAVVAVSSVLFILILTAFTRSAVAVGE